MFLPASCGNKTRYVLEGLEAIATDRMAFICFLFFSLMRKGADSLRRKLCTETIVA